jgi:uncharacterized protein with HEPN domain
MPRDYKVYLEDIIEAIGKIHSYTSDLSLQTFSSDAKTFDAVIRNLEIIGEAIKGVPEDVRSRYADVEWKKIVGLRDILIHEYFGVDVEIIWDIIQNKLPILERQIKRMIEE